MTLATATADGVPGARTVLLRGRRRARPGVPHQPRVAQGARAGREPACVGGVSPGSPLQRQVRGRGRGGAGWPRTSPTPTGPPARTALARRAGQPPVAGDRSRAPSWSARSPSWPSATRRAPRSRVRSGGAAIASCPTRWSSGGPPRPPARPPALPAHGRGVGRGAAGAVMRGLRRGVARQLGDPSGWLWPAARPCPEPGEPRHQRRGRRGPRGRRLPPRRRPGLRWWSGPARTARRPGPARDGRRAGSRRARDRHKTVLARAGIRPADARRGVGGLDPARRRIGRPAAHHPHALLLARRRGGHGRAAPRDGTGRPDLRGHPAPRSDGGTTPSTSTGSRSIRRRTCGSFWRGPASASVEVREGEKQLLGLAGR